MKVSELADLADTTVRTVRHYHHLGLLTVPEMAGGIRDYGLPHLVRLLRIRWLVDSGMSLAAVSDVLPDDRPAGGEAIVGELRDTLAELDDGIRRLQARRERLTALLDLAENGDEVTPLPPALARVYQRLLPRIPTPQARQAAETERALAVVLAVRGMLPPVVEEFAAAMTEADDEDVLAMYVALIELDHPRDDAGTNLQERRDALMRPLWRTAARHSDILLAAVERDDIGALDRHGAAGLLGTLARLGFPGEEQQRLIAEWTDGLASPDFTYPDIPTTAPAEEN